MRKLPNDLRRLYREALSEDGPDLDLSDAAIDARWKTIEGALAEVPPLTIEELTAFISDGRELTHAQHRLLFTDQALRERYRVLMRELAVPLRRRAPGPAGVLEIPAQVAAASADTRDFRRRFEGGELRGMRAGVEDQFYLIIVLDDPDAVPRALIVERARDRARRRLPLPPPADREILVVVDLAIPGDAALVDLLRDSTSTGTFVR
jgi:hypothetical protein